MNNLENHLETVEQARIAFIEEASGLSAAQEHFKPAPEVWSIAEIVEHIYWAEKVGIRGMWAASTAFKTGTSLWSGENSNEGLSIETVVEKTWQTKEKVPEIAKPQWGGPVSYWIANLEACTPLLLALSKQLEGLDLEQIIYPHPISGPLNVHQRLQFLSFHMKRHQQQIKNVKLHPDYPKI